MLHLILSFLLSTLPSPNKGPVAAPALVDIVGVYSCLGSDESNQPYSGVVIIEKQGEDGFAFTWVIEKRIASRGIAYRNGNVDVIAAMASPNGGIAVARYQITQADGKLKLIGKYLSGLNWNNETLTKLE